MKKEENNQTFFEDSLQLIINTAQQSESIKIREIFKILSGRGYAALLIILSLPFCFPVQIPGFSTPFGILLAFLGLRIAFAKRLWWPKWVLEKNLSSKSVSKLMTKTMKVVHAMQKILHPRLLFITRNPLLHRLHGLLVGVLGVLLSLPLPIPMTNLLSAFPILCIGLGLLEDDGMFVLIGYFSACICFTAFTGLFLFGKQFV